VPREQNANVGGRGWGAASWLRRGKHHACGGGVVRGHRFRMVRFLHLRIARNDHCSPLLFRRRSVPRLHLRSSDVCRRLRCAPAWGARVRQVRRSARAKTRLSGHDHADGPRDGRRGAPPRLQVDRNPGALSARILARHPGLRHRRRIWRRGDLRGGARCKAQARRCDGLDPGRWNIGAISCAGGDPDLPHHSGRRCIPALGLAYPLSAFRGPARHFSVDQAAPR